MSRLALLAVLVLPLAACATDGADAPTPASAASTGPTYHKDVAPLLVARCNGCHGQGGVAPFALETYAQAKSKAKLIVGATQDRSMPPWGARETAECQPRLPFRHDLRLSAAELDLLKAWSAAGAPEGDPETAPKEVQKVPLTLAQVDSIATPKAPYVTSGDSDEFRCFVLDVGFAERKYLKGMQIVPGNHQVVHHALVFTASEKAIAKKTLDAADSYECFGGIGLDDQQLVGAWAPGSVPQEFPAGTGAILEKGTRLVMQIHYHPAGAQADPDVTKVQLHYVDGTPQWVGLTALIGNFPAGKDGQGLLPGPNDPGGQPAFHIPAGAKGHTETMQFTLPKKTDEGNPMPDLHVLAVGTHMHYVGTNMRIELDRTSARKAPCTDAQLAPLSECTKQACPGKAGAELVECAVAKCQAEAAALTGACGDCLQAQIATGKAEAEVYAACTTPPPAPQGPAQPDQECLVETPAWDFNWQRIYQYDGPLEGLPVFRPGETMKMTCTYDNSLDNPFVQLALEQLNLTAPKDVLLGETTLDEMCLAVVQVVWKL